MYNVNIAQNKIYVFGGRALQNRENRP